MEILNRTEKQRLILDFDGVIANSMKAICDTYNEDFRYYKDFKPVDWCNVQTWTFDELKLATKKYISHLWNQPRFFERLEFMDNAEETLDILKNEYDIEIVSMAFTPNGRGKKIWIQERMPYVKHIEIVNMREYIDKSHIDMSNAVFVDDTSRNLLSSNAKKKILFGDVYDWNIDWTETRCYNWYEMLAELVLHD